MARLTQEAVQAVCDYVAARYSHLEKSERKLRRKKTIRALKKESPERIDQYISDVKEALSRSGM
jgi:Lhr-like helicase